MSYIKNICLTQPEKFPAYQLLEVISLNVFNVLISEKNMIGAGL